MSQADVKNHLSARRKKIVFPFGPVSPPDATCFSGDEPRGAKVNASCSGDLVDTQQSKSRNREIPCDVPARGMRAA
jgi:hypothetical protein